MKKEYIFLILVTSLAIIVFLTIVLWPRKTNQPPITIQPSASPIRPFSEFQPIKMDTVPFTADGSKTDLNSETIKNSQAEINKLESGLPFQKDIVTASGKSLSILVPSQKNQYNPWTLSVNISGVNYQIGQTDPQYTLRRQDFLEATEVVFTWMKSLKADPNKIIITWGDKEYIQNKAEEWLSRP